MRRSGLGFRALVAAMLVFAAAPAQAFVSFTQAGDAWFTVNDFTYLDKSAHYGGTFLDVNKTDSFGAVYGSSPFAFGAEAEGGVVLKAGVDAYTHLDNQMSVAWKQSYVSYVLGADTNGGSTVGTPFVIGQNSSFESGQKINTGAGDLKVTVDVNSQISIGGSGRGCFFGCVDADFGVYTGSPPNPVFSYGSASNTATFLGTEYQNALPQTFSDPHNIVSAALNRADLTGSAEGTDPLSVTLHQTTTLAAVSTNIAAAVATAYGIPPEALKGDLLGFNYETLGLTVAASLNMSQDVTVTPLGSINTYHFTTPVQIYNQATDTWTDPSQSVTVFANHNVTVRALDATSVGFTVEHKANFQSTTDVSFDAILQATLTVLHIDGHGVDWSLFQKKYDLFDQALGSLDRQVKNSSYVSTYEAPVNLKFFAPVADIGFGTGLITISFLNNPEDEDDTTQTNLFFQVINFGAVGCNSSEHGNCVVDSRFRPYANQSRIVPRSRTAARGIPDAADAADGVETISANFTRLDEVLGVPISLDDPNLNMQALFDLLARVQPGGQPDFNVLAHGAPADEIIPFDQHGSRVFGVAGTVPEPATWAMLIGGFGLMGGAARRRRVVIA